VNRLTRRWHARAGAACLLAAAALVAPVTANASAAAGQLPANVRAACAWPPTAAHAACLALVRTDIAGRIGVLSGTVPYGYGPADLQSAYKLATAAAADGRGQTVAIVDAYDDPNAESDLAVYRAQYKLPACTTANGCFAKVNESGRRGDYPLADPGWAVEISLVLDMVSAICPHCHILLVEATSSYITDLGSSVDEAVALGAKFASNSYGMPEQSVETAFDGYYKHPGVAITAASGDYGYGTLWPSAFRYVTAVGGTSLLPASNARGWDEIAWSYGGSGCSPYETKPSWQTDAGCASRTVADVAAIADPDADGVAVYDSYQTGGWLVVGGTSVASPIIASVYALAGTPQSGTYPAEYPYEHRGALFNIVAGTNSFTGCNPTYLCNAGPGYNGPTGLGTPDGVAAFR
jgi:subtilase family serine protease